MQELTSPTIQSYHSTCSFIRKLYLILVFDQLNRHSTDPFNCQTGVFMNYCFPSLFSFHQMQIIKHPNCMWVGKYKILCKPPIHAQRVFFRRPLTFRDLTCMFSITLHWRRMISPTRFCMFGALLYKVVNLKEIRQADAPEASSILLCEGSP